MAGEGAAFFALANKLDPTCYCEVRVVQVFSFNTADYVVSKVKTILADNKIEEIDVLISGNNGDVEAEKVFDSVSGALNVQKNTLKYKHFCGEYPTSNAFAMWMGAEILKEKNVPAAFECNIQNKKIRNVLIYNQNKNLHHSLILLSAC